MDSFPFTINNDRNFGQFEGHTLSHSHTPNRIGRTLSNTFFGFHDKLAANRFFYITTFEADKWHNQPTTQIDNLLFSFLSLWFFSFFWLMFIFCVVFFIQMKIKSGTRTRNVTSHTNNKTFVDLFFFRSIQNTSKVITRKWQETEQCQIQPKFDIVVQKGKRRRRRRKHCCLKSKTSLLIKVITAGVTHVVNFNEMKYLIDCNEWLWNLLTVLARASVMNNLSSNWIIGMGSNNFSMNLNCCCYYSFWGKSHTKVTKTKSICTSLWYFRKAAISFVFCFTHKTEYILWFIDEPLFLLIARCVHLQSNQLVHRILRLSVQNVVQWKWTID